jgi:Putative prokaryotic signal transducing protein
MDPWEGDELRRRVRKIKPQLSEGELVRVIGAANQAEAEMIQGMLLEEGVPSMVRRAGSADVPDFLAAGQRDVLVPASGAATAREVLMQAELLGDQTPATSPRRLLAGLLLAVVLVAVVVLLGAELLM